VTLEEVPSEQRTLVTVYLNNCSHLVRSHMV